MRKVLWFVVNGIMLALLWAGIVMDMKGPRNVALFAVWAFTLLSMMTGLSEKACREMSKMKGWPTMPLWVEVAYDMLVIGLLAWHGFFISGAAWTVQLLMVVTTMERVKKIKREEAHED